MTLAQAIRNAVSAEEAAERFYRMLAKRTNHPDAARFLNRLAEQELVHADNIREFGRTVNAGGALLNADTLFENVEIAPDWVYLENITFDEALGLAIQNEQKAATFYDALSDSVTGAAGAFFKKLVAEETQHANTLKEFIKQNL